MKSLVDNGNNRIKEWGKDDVKMEHIKIVCKIPSEIALQEGFLNKLIKKMERQVKNTGKSLHMTIEITWGQQDQSEVISNVPITDYSSFGMLFGSSIECLKSELKSRNCKGDKE